MSGFDFIGYCRPGMVLKTKDHRDARIEAVDAAAGSINGLVQMFGPCSWTASGRYLEAPAGAAGPLDLVPPAPIATVSRGEATESLAEALNDPSARPFCCD